MTRTILLSDIKIKKNFRRSKPSEDKMNEVRDYFNTYGTIDKTIVISEDNYLIDGYVRYLVLQENNIGVCICEVESKKVSKKKPKKYVYGYHLGNLSKEYVWCCNQNFDVDIGDMIAVATRYGRKSIIVSRIETLLEPPIKSTIHRALNVIKTREEILNETYC